MTQLRSSFGTAVLSAMALAISSTAIASDIDLTDLDPDLPYVITTELSRDMNRG